MDCLFCKIINNEIASYILYEDDLIKVILDAYPENNGHTLILPKKHYQTFEDLDNNIREHIFLKSIEIKNLLMTKLNAKGITLLCNYGESQVIKHFHLHLIPNFGKKEEIKKVEDIYSILSQ